MAFLFFFKISLLSYLFWINSTNKLFYSIEPQSLKQSRMSRVTFLQCVKVFMPKYNTSIALFSEIWLKTKCVFMVWVKERKKERKYNTWFIFRSIILRCIYFVWSGVLTLLVHILKSITFYVKLRNNPGTEGLGSNFGPRWRKTVMCCNSQRHLPKVYNKSQFFAIVTVLLSLLFIHYKYNNYISYCDFTMNESWKWLM